MSYIQFESTVRSWNTKTEKCITVCYNPKRLDIFRSGLFFYTMNQENGSTTVHDTKGKRNQREMKKIRCKSIRHEERKEVEQW